MRKDMELQGATGTVHIGYRPAPEDVAVKTDVSEFLSRELGRKIVTWLNRDGEWIVSYEYENGKRLDLAFAGKGDRPEITQGTLETIRSMESARAKKKGPLYQLEEYKKKLMEQQEQRADKRKWMKKMVSRHYHDDPFYNPGGGHKLKY